MKKLILLTAISFIWLTALLPLNVSAADITVGATTWYSWWDFDQSGNTNNTEFDSALLYGPALSVKFNEDYNMTFVFLYGNFDMNETDSGTGTKTTRELTRTDSDLALNYRLSNYFKIFAGAKYMSYKMPDFDHSSIGPGAGISFVVPVGGDFFILGNISGLYLWGRDDQNDEKDNYKEYGANSSLSIAYYIASASTTISLGGRYQYFKTDYPDNNDITHQFYGATLSANYSFSI